MGDDLGPVAVRLPDEGHVELLRSGRRPVDRGVCRHLTVQGAGAQSLVIGESEPLGNQTPVVARGDLGDQVELVGRVAIPVDRDDPERADLVDRPGQDAGIVEVAEEEVDRALGVRAADLPEKLRADPRAAPFDEALLLGMRRIEVPEHLAELVPELHDVMTEIDQRQEQVVAPEARPQG